MKSNFSKLKQEIEALKCQDCGGLGEMSTGWQDQIERQLTIKQR